MYHQGNQSVFVGGRLWTLLPPPALKIQMRSFTSIQMFHTHTPLGGVKNWGPDCEVKMRMTRDEGEMSMTMRWELLNKNPGRGTHKKKRRNQEKTPTPTHLARSGRTLKRQGKRKSGGRRKQTQTGGGGGGRKRLNQLKPQRKQDLPKHARTRTYLERGSTHEIGDQWGPSWLKTEPKTAGFSPSLRESNVVPITGPWSINPHGV